MLASYSVPVFFFPFFFNQSWEMPHAILLLNFEIEPFKFELDYL